MTPHVEDALRLLAAQVHDEPDSSWLAKGALPDGAFRTDDLERLLYHSGAPVNLIRDGSRRNRVGVDDLVEAMPLGWTVQVEEAERYSEPLARLAGKLEEELGGDPVRVNLYYSPVAETLGFPAHHDTLDALILQVSGAKRWEVWDRQIEHPIWMMRHHDQPVHDRPARLEVTLEPGDVLFVRQGDPHRASCSEPPSLHLTVGLRRPIGHHLLQWLVDQATDLPEVRAPAPWAMGLDDMAGDRVAWATAVLEHFVHFLASASPETWLARYLDERAATRGVTPAPGLAGPSRVVSESSLVRVSHPQLAARRSGDRLVFGHRIVRFPEGLGGALDALGSDRQRWWPVHELARATGIEVRPLVALAQALVDQGYLVIASWSADPEMGR